MKLSVIIPTYNGEKTIRRAIESVLKQTLKLDTEILICDDRSTDRTIEICRQYPECKMYFNQEHVGNPNPGRNIGIKKATGDYVAFLDQDDFWTYKKIELQFKELKNGAELVYSRCIVES